MVVINRVAPMIATKPGLSRSRPDPSFSFLHITYYIIDMNIHKNIVFCLIEIVMVLYVCKCIDSVYVYDCNLCYCFVSGQNKAHHSIGSRFLRAAACRAHLRVAMVRHLPFQTPFMGI